jgi:hypothetical protein
LICLRREPVESQGQPKPIPKLTNEIHPKGGKLMIESLPPFRLSAFRFSNEVYL